MRTFSVSEQNIAHFSALCNRLHPLGNILRTTMRKPAKAAPAPIIPTARRLEQIREASDFQSLRAFWGHVLDGWRDEYDHPVALSYEAVRTYHYDKPAPASYLARVAALFGYRLDWLVTGEGARTQAEASVTQRAVELLDPKLDAVLSFNRYTPATRAVFDETWRRIVAGIHAPEGGLSEVDVTAVGFQLWRLIDIVPELFGFRHADELSDREINDFYRAMLHALALVVPESRKGDDPRQRGVDWADGVQPQYVANRGAAMEKLNTEFQSEIAAAKEEIERFNDLARSYGFTAAEAIDVIAAAKAKREAESAHTAPPPERKPRKRTQRKS